jgi:hypothetical protein
MDIHADNTIIIQSENDLHFKVVQFLRKHYSKILFVTGLGELQSTSYKRCMAWKKGYRSGTCDLIILKSNDKYNGLAFEFKNPKGTGRISTKQLEFCTDLSNNNFRVIISNDYDEIIKEVIMYMISE